MIVRGLDLIGCLLLPRSHEDKSAGGRFLEEFEETSLRLQDFCTCLGVEVNERSNIMTMLKECKVYHASKLAELQATAQV